MSCIICGEPVEKRFEYCDRCFNSAIDELNEKYGKKEGPFSTQEDEEEALADNPWGVARHS